LRRHPFIKRAPKRQTANPTHPRNASRMGVYKITFGHKRSYSSFAEAIRQIRADLGVHFDHRERPDLGRQRTLLDVVREWGYCGVASQKPTFRFRPLGGHQSRQKHDLPMEAL